MKTLLVLLVTVFLTSAQAEQQPQVSALKATEISVKVNSARCPQGAICEILSTLVVTYTAQGCLDTIVVTGSADADLTPEGKRRVNLSAVNLHNPESKVVMCVRMPTKTVNVTLGMAYATKENVEVVELTEVLK